jgi:WD40 repeat protein
VAFSPDSKQVVSGSYDQTIRLWDAATGALLQMLRGHTNVVYSVAFSPDGKQVVSGSSDQTIRLWDAATGAPLQTLPTLTSSVYSVAFTPDGKLWRVLQVSNYWVVEGDRNILWLPPDYRKTCLATWNRSIVIGHQSGTISFFCFKKGAKLVI